MKTLLQVAAATALVAAFTFPAQGQEKTIGVLTVDKGNRVFMFQQNTLHALRDLLCACGLGGPGELGPEHIIRRVSPVEVRSLGALYRFLEPGELLHGHPEHAVFREFWASSRAESFEPPARVASLRSAKSR